MHALLISLWLIAGALLATPPPLATSTPAPKREVFPSPNGVFTATLPFYAGRVVFTAQDGRRQEASWPKWISFVGWTPDSRFAILNYYDQYGNTWGHTFDTTKWKLFEIVSVLKNHKRCMPTMEGGCKEGVKLIAPDDKRLMLYDGTVVRMVDLAK
jgi:hypothetical protein